MTGPDRLDPQGSRPADVPPPVRLAGAEQRWVRRGDVSLHVTAAGPAHAPVVVFVHGYPDSSLVWHAVMAELADRYRVVAYDVRGFGSSSIPSTRRGGWTLDQLTADFVAVVDAVSPDRPVHLVGHDWGSVQAWAFAMDEDAGTRIASLTSISGPSLDLVRPWVHAARHSRRRLVSVLRQGMRSAYVGFFQLPLVPEGFWRVAGARVGPMIYALPDDPDRAAAADRVAPTFARDARVGLQLYRQNVLRRTVRPRRIAADLTMPVQLIVPTRDRFLLPALYDDLPDLVPVFVRRDLDAGHWVPHSHPQVLARWIDEHARATDLVDEAHAGGTR